MEKLKADIKSFEKKLPPDIGANISEEQLKECSKYPFNRYANALAFLLGKSYMSYEEFLQLRDAYYDRNPNIGLFELSPRDFGQNYIENHLIKNYPILQKPSIDLDPEYKGEYDIWLPIENGQGLKIEVKASHVVQDTEGGSLEEKALQKLAKSDGIQYQMNFQQLKPLCCDVFIWIAVWLNDFDFWVLPSNMIRMRPKDAPRLKEGESIIRSISGEDVIYMGPQHRNSTDEGQVLINHLHYSDIKKYSVPEQNIVDKIFEYGKVNQRT